MFSFRPTVIRLLAVVGITASVFACSNDVSTGPSNSPLAGLDKSTARDTAGTSTPTGSAPGYFRGTVRGSTGQNMTYQDSMAAMPYVGNVQITIYQQKVGESNVVEAGAQVGSAVTGASGEFTLPTLPAGNYVVTFIPPESSGYRGIWVSSTLYQNSSQYPWLIVLPKK